MDETRQTAKLRKHDEEILGDSKKGCVSATLHTRWH